MVKISAGMAELADAWDLKSHGPKGHEGSTPSSGTTRDKLYGHRRIKT